MPGIRVEVKWDDREARRIMDALLRRVSDLTPIMRQIGEQLMTSTSRRFESAVDPSGRSWPSVGAFAQSAQRGGSPLSGRHLARPGLGYAYEAGRDQVALGTRLVYGLVHQFGTQGKGGALPDIVPTHGKFLTIPLPGVTRTARSYANTFVRKGMILQRTGKGGVKPLFLLRPKVAIPPRPFIGVSRGDWAAIGEILRQALAKAA